MSRLEEDRIGRYLEVKLGRFGKDRYGLVRLISEYTEWIEPVEDDIDGVREFVRNYRIDAITNKPEFCYVRFYLFAYLRKKTNMSFASIGSMFKGKDHASVMHGIKMHNQYMSIKDSKYIDITSYVRNAFVIPE